MKAYKVKAGALQLTLYIAAVISLLLASFILFVHIHNRFSIQTKLVKTAIQQVENNIWYALKQNITVPDSIIISQENPYAIVSKTSWGIFEKITSRVTTKKTTYTRQALSGPTGPTQGTALIMGSTLEPLTMSGYSIINGEAYISDKGIRSGTIAGHGFYGNTFVNGHTATTKGLPQLNQTNIQHLTNLTKQVTNGSIDKFLNWKMDSNFSNSFSQPTKYIYSKEALYIEKSTVSGNIIIQSDISISIGSNQHLNNVILIAPKIIFEESFSGNCQAFASRKLWVKENCKFNYPSVLWVQADPFEDDIIPASGKQDMPIVIEKGNVIKGIIGYYNSKSIRKNYQSQILLEDNSQLYGELYCTHNTELLGTVFGTVYTYSFIVHNNSSIYQNHLYNGKIDNTKLAAQYGGLPLTSTNTKTIVTWLH